MSQKIRSLNPHTPDTSPDTGTLFTILELPIGASEKQVWRSPIYETLFLHHYAVPACGVIVRDGKSGSVTVELYAPALLFNHAGFRSAHEIAALLGLPALDMMWTRDYATEARMGDYVKRGELLVPTQGMRSPNGHQ